MQDNMKRAYFDDGFYAIFRAAFLLCFWGLLMGLMQFLWRRSDIEYHRHMLALGNVNYAATLVLAFSGFILVFYFFIVFVLELIGVVFRPFSLQLRLMANLNGDHMVLFIFSDMIPLLVPCVFLALGIFVSVVQAFVFTLLSTVYVGLSVAHHEEEHH